MPSVVLRAPAVFEAGFAAIRAELGVPAAFPDEVLAEAASAGPATGSDQRTDACNLPLIAIDPPGATDLDQALSVERRGDGYRVHYAIADVGDFIRPGGALDREARARGTTLYCPDLRTPLHPPVLSEDRASLLPGGRKPALLWTIDLDGDGEPVDWHLERAEVRIRAAISYQQAQQLIDAGDDLRLLAEIGALRQQRETDRGGVSFNLPAQEIVATEGSYALELDRSLPVEGWNAQISLLTGIVAARTMVDAGLGVLRTLPAATGIDIERLRLTAAALGLDWPGDTSYPVFVRSLDPSHGPANAFLIQATRTLRGAGYVGFVDGAPPAAGHSAIASVYAHVTAPLRRLVDRFGNEVVLAVLCGRRPPGWALDALDELPSLMGRAGQRESALERALLDFAETVVLEHSIGRTFTGLVVHSDRERERIRVQISEAAVVVDVDGVDAALGSRIGLRLTAADPAKRSLSFSVDGQPADVVT